MKIDMERKLTAQNGITEGVIWKQLLIFFFPILFGTFFQQLYNTVDAIVVGNFVGTEALAAVGGATSTIINLLIGFFVGLSSGATVIISQFYGARDGQNVSKAVHTAIAMSLIIGLIFMVVGLIFSPMALKAMDTPEDVLPLANTYIRVYFGGVLFTVIYNVGSAILRAIGDSRRPLYFLIVCCLVNVVLDLLFVAGFHMGVFGAAIATMISQAISAVLIIVTLMRTPDCYRLYLRQIRIDMGLLRGIFRIGLPAGLQSTMYNVANIIIQASINSFGTETIAAWTAFGKIDGMFWMIMDAFGVSITTFVGQNFGARKYDRIHKSVRICIAMAMGATVLLSTIFLLFGGNILGMFTQDAEVLSIGIEIMHVTVPLYFTYVCITVLSGTMRGTGESLVPMLMTAVGTCVLRIVWIFTAVPVWHDIKTVMFSYPLTWAVTSMLFLIYYLQGGWLRRQIRNHFGEQEKQQ